MPMKYAGTLKQKAEKLFDKTSYSQTQFEAGLNEICNKMDDKNKESFIDSAYDFWASADGKAITKPQAIVVIEEVFSKYLGNKDNSPSPRIEAENALINIDEYLKNSTDQDHKGAAFMFAQIMSQKHPSDLPRQRDNNNAPKPDEPNNI